MDAIPGPILQCQSCDKTFPLAAPLWKCVCGGVIDVRGTAIFRKDELAQRPLNFWRYWESLALPSATPRITLGEVMTPIVTTSLRGWRISLKLEYVLPTGSYKDRGIAVCMNHLSRMGVETIAEDSSGNAGASTAAYAAAAGFHADIYVPETASPAKINQIRIYGAQCHLVPGTRTEAALQAQGARGGRQYIGHSWNPLFACGVKSVAYEIAEQSGWQSPDWIVVPLGGGSLVLGLIDGFAELLAAGYVQSLPRILAVQSAACAPIYQAWLHNDATITAAELHPTVGEGVAISNPPRGNQVLQALRRCHGAMLAVDDAELLSCWRDMARIGIFMEPTSAIAVAGAWLARQSHGMIEPADSVVVLVTGHGLKTAQALMKLPDTHLVSPASNNGSP